MARDKSLEIVHTHTHTYIYILKEKLNKKIIITLLILLVILISMYIFCMAYQSENKFIHISVDDTIEIFRDLTENENKYDSIFDNEILKFMQKCHNLYGTKFSMYVFYNYGEGITLEQCTNKFRSEFEENSDWLKFGFHALDNSIDYELISPSSIQQQYNEFINILARIVRRKEY